MKKILSLTLVTLLILSLAVSAHAAGLSITGASNSISKSGTTVYMGQTTNTSQTATKIKHVRTLQRKIGGTWYTYQTITSYKYNASVYSHTLSRSVVSGYYYRVKTQHYCYEGTTQTDSRTVYSSEIYVG